MPVLSVDSVPAAHSVVVAVVAVLSSLAVGLSSVVQLVVCTDH